jgi:hypothetical protein
MEDILFSSQSEFEWSYEEEMTWFSSDDLLGDSVGNYRENSKDILVKIEHVISDILHDLEEERVPSVVLPSK